ncbi:MAG: oxaloacetate decarboxylase (Na+ extruding) subunit alpha [Abditibacteriota bacterium]|nr:oxaloacetate decarboxylase (Na+ extruding) subunit alpha [Abditibacteriota bacterium]
MEQRLQDDAEELVRNEDEWKQRVEFMRGLAAVVRDENLSELSLVQDGLRIHLRSTRAPLLAPPQQAVMVAGQAPVVADASAAGNFDSVLESEAPDDEVPAIDTEPIVSPMVGVFYRAKSPDEPNFVEIGDRVEVGQIIGLVEAMKTFNEITSEIEGEVMAIPAENAQLVETGAPLVLVRKV